MMLLNNRRGLAILIVSSLNILLAWFAVSSMYLTHKQVPFGYTQRDLIIALKKAMEPGPNTDRFIRSIRSKSRIPAIAEVYRSVKADFVYTPDPPMTEIVRTAEYMLESGMKGDCEDLAVTYCTIFDRMDLKTRLTFLENSESGHIFAEVQLASNSRDGYKSAVELLRILNANRIDIRIDSNGESWMILDGYPDIGIADIPDGRISMALYPDGNVKKTNQDPVILRISD